MWVWEYYMHALLYLCGANMDAFRSAATEKQFGVKQEPHLKLPSRRAPFSKMLGWYHISLFLCRYWNFHYGHSVGRTLYTQQWLGQLLCYIVIWVLYWILKIIVTGQGVVEYQFPVTCNENDDAFSYRVLYHFINFYHCRNGIGSWLILMTR